jgi:hypothetical protein
MNTAMQVGLSIKSRAPWCCDGRRFVQLEFGGEGDATARRFPSLHPLSSATAAAHVGPHAGRRGQPPRHAKERIPTIFEETALSQSTLFQMTDNVAH